MSTVRTRQGALLRLCALIVALTPLTEAQVLLGYRDLPRPSGAHVTVLPLASPAVGFPRGAHHARELQILLTAYGEAATQALDALATALWSDAPAMHAASADGLAIRAVAPVQDQTALQATSYEPRSSVTVTVGFVAAPEVPAPAEAGSITLDVDGETVLEASL